MQSYICLAKTATNGYELYDTLHRKKIEMQLSTISIVA